MSLPWPSQVDEEEEVLGEEVKEEVEEETETSSLSPVKDGCFVGRLLVNPFRRKR